MKNRMLLLVLVPALLMCSLFFLGCGASSSSGGHGSNPFVADIYVSPTGTDESSDPTWGHSVSKPFRTIQKGLYTAMTGEVVGVLAGVYTEEVVWCPTWEYVTLRGVSKTTAVLHGKGSGPCILIEDLPQYRVVTIESMMITKGAFPGSDGGGIRLSQDNIILHLKDAIVTNNSASNGGGLFIKFPTDIVYVENCTFTSNEASASGGGICQDNGYLAITGSTFRYNTGNNGGGVSTKGGAALGSCQFSDNSASTYGGGLYIYGGNAYVAGCTFTRNSSSNSGGGIYDVGVTSTIEACAFTSNSSSTGGGLHIEANAGNKLFVKQAVFTGNIASAGDGGGIQAANPIDIEQCYFVLNTAEASGGGLAVSDLDEADVENCLFEGNYAATAGGGVHYSKSSDTTLLLMNCTVYGNYAGQGTGIYLSDGAEVSIINSIISGNYADGGGGVMEIYDNGGGFTMSYNCFLPTNESGSYTSVEASNTTAGPLFVAAPINLRLANACPVSITKGATTEGTPLPYYDLDGIIARTIPYSMGAYETNN